MNAHVDYSMRMQELEEQRSEAKAKNLPPKYMGKWGTASDAEIEAEIAKGTPYTYRFRVPQDGSITIKDLVRGEVSDPPVVFRVQFKRIYVYSILEIGTFTGCFL